MLALMGLEFSYEPTANEAGLQRYKFQCGSSGTWKRLCHHVLDDLQIVNNEEKKKINVTFHTKPECMSGCLLAPQAEMS